LGRVASSHAYNLLRPTQQLHRLRSGRRPPDVIAQIGNHLVQRLDLFVGDAGLGDLHELEHGLRVDEGEEAGKVARAVFGFEGF
jgi:hypothetical protein